MDEETHTADRVSSRSNAADKIMPDKQGRVHFITGATGFIGSYFLYSRAGQPETLIALLQGSSKDEARERLERRLESCAASYRRPFKAVEWRERIRVVLGNTTDQNCGLDETSLVWLRQAGVDDFWHFETSNFGGPADIMQTQPIHSTRLALDLAHAIAAKRFIYLSSAFSVGRQSGLVREQLHPLPREFDNPYEESMCQAEHEVAYFCEANNIDYRILRPSIVIGPSLTMKTGGCQSGLYGLVREISELQPTLSSPGHSFSIIGSPETPFNLIPVDHLMADVSNLIENNFPGGPIYHLTSTYNLTVGVVLWTVFEIIGIGQTPQYVAPDAKRSSLEELLDERISSYSSYMRDGKQFERSLARLDGVTKEELYGYLVECMRELHCETEVNLFDRRWSQAPDQTWFCGYLGADTNLPAVVLINAIGMPVLLLAPIALHLARQFRLVTWESRWVPSPDGVFDPQKCYLDNHLIDLTSLLESNGVDRAHIIGWCNGAQLALKFASLFPERTRSLVLLNGTFNLPESITRTVFEKNMRFLMPKIAGNMAFAQLYYRMTSEERFRSDDPERQGEAAGQSSSFITCRNPALRHLTNAPFRTPELLYRYANMVTRSFEEPEPALAANMAMPVLVVSGSDDRVTHPETSREIARRIKGASLVMIEGGDHHALHDDERVQNIVLDFLMRFERTPHAVEKNEVPCPNEATTPTLQGTLIGKPV